MGKASDRKKIYDDDLTETISEVFNDRTRTIPILGDIIRALHLSIRRKDITFEEFLKMSIDKIEGRVTRFDIAQLTKIDTIRLNSMSIFINGGPTGEYWNTANNGFYDWIDNKSSESIFGVELGFKADDYGLEVCSKLIEKKRKNPNINISLLIDGFVSYLMNKPGSSREEFENNTISMVNNMRREKINVLVNDSWNPLSSDFLSANHIKLWIFDEIAAFYGGIGIESQFRTTLYDEMDLVQGPIVGIMSIMLLLLMANQKREFHLETPQNGTWITRAELQRIYNKNKGMSKGSMNMKIFMNVPGYVQDAQQEYVTLLTRPDVKEIYILAPYFSDDKIARALIIAANKLHDKLNKPVRSKTFHGSPEATNLQDNKRIHVVFPKKQENKIIEEVSRYYAYYLRNNPIVETRQFVFEKEGKKFDILHAKQMVVILEDEKRGWTKYVKFGGSYNPAGRAQNMWEMNAVLINGNWNDTDEGPNSAAENPIRDYVNNVLKLVISKYSEPFPWGQVDVKLSLLDKISMKFSQILWF
jgi:hypothetical protein